VNPSEPKALNRRIIVVDVVDEVQTKLRGHPVRTPVELMAIRLPGSDDEIRRPLTPEDLESQVYLDFKAGRSTGTPLEKLLDRPLGDSTVTPEILDKLRAAGCSNVENVAFINDSGQIPMRNTLRRLALDVLAAGEESRVAAVAASRDAQVQSLQQQVEQLRELVSELRGLRGPGADHA